MDFLKKKRIRQVLQYGWKDAKEIARTQDVNKSRVTLFIDILYCFYKFYVFSNQYKHNRLWEKKNEEREPLCHTLGKTNHAHDNKVVNYYKIYFKNWMFLDKYTGLKWQRSPRMFEKRNAAYANNYGFGKNVSVQYGVMIICEHFNVGKIIVGENVLFARGCDIDYTGDLIIEDNVKVSEGVKILTHKHDLDFTQREDLGHGLSKTALVIRDNVGIGARAVIMPGVCEIGRGAMITTSSVVKKRVPPYAIVMGNPARVVGFRYTPNQIIELEEEVYPVEKRLSENLLRENYQRYYLDKIQEIKQFLG